MEAVQTVLATLIAFGIMFAILRVGLWPQTTAIARFFLRRLFPHLRERWEEQSNIENELFVLRTRQEAVDTEFWRAYDRDDGDAMVRLKNHEVALERQIQDLEDKLAG